MESQCRGRLRWVMFPRFARGLLWSEYRAPLPEGAGIGYSVCCAELAALRSDRDLAHSHDHVPGEKGYFDFAA